MNTIKTFIHITLCTVLAGAAGGAQATSLGDLTGTPGSSITAGDKLFDQWTAIHNVSFGTASLDLGEVTVAPLSDGGLNPGPGLGFTILPPNGLSVTGDDIYAFTDFMFGFRVSSTDASLLIEDASLGLGDWSLASTTGLNCTPSTDPSTPCNDLGFAIAENVFSDAGGTNLLGSMLTQVSYLNGVMDKNISSGHISFSPLSQVWVQKNILVWAVNGTDTASLISFTQRFSQTPVSAPEPSSLMLLGVGLAVLARRRRTS